MEPDEYRELAVEALTGILASERAAIWSEIEARASERPWADLPRPVDPHHLTTARRLLVQDGVIIETTDVTRGGHRVETLSLAGDQRRLVDAAAARKRLLHGRFLGWATGTKRHPKGLIGGAGEDVVDASLQAATATGYRPFERHKGDVTELFGKKVPGGSLDNGAHLILMKDGLPSGVVSILVEVKNIREWLYPNSTEIYQLLTKAAQLQVDNPDQRFVPVLVCRRAHWTLFKMAKQLGFYVVALSRQFINQTSDVTDERLVEVRHELGYSDLLAKAGEDKLMTKHFKVFVPREAPKFAEQWAITAPVLGDYFPVLRKPHQPADRAIVLNQLRTDATSTFGKPGGW